MTHKQNIIAINRPAPHYSLILHLREIMVNLRRMMEVPTGYQDETGFHFGEEPAQREFTLPNF